MNTASPAGAVPALPPLPETPQPYSPTAEDPDPYVLSTDNEGNIEIGHDWIPVETRNYEGDAGQRTAYLWQNIVHRFDPELAVGQRRPYDPTNVVECQRLANIIKGLRDDYINRGKIKIGSLIATNFKEWGYTINHQSPSNIKMVTNIIKGDQFESDFKANPKEMLTKLYWNVNLTVESPEWRAEAVKEVNSAKKIVFMDASETDGAEGNKVHCSLRIITSFVNKWVLEAITKACDLKLKCSLRREKREKDKTAIGYELLIIPGAMKTLFVRHLKNSSTYSGSSPQNDYKYALNTLVRYSTIANKSLDEVKLDLESEAALKVASDEAVGKPSASISMAPSSGSSLVLSAPAPAPFSRFSGGSGGGQLGGDGDQSYYSGIEPQSYDKDHLVDPLDIEDISNFSWGSRRSEGMSKDPGLIMKSLTANQHQKGGVHGHENSLGERSEKQDDATDDAEGLHQSTTQRHFAQLVGFVPANKVTPPGRGKRLNKDAAVKAATQRKANAPARVSNPSQTQNQRKAVELRNKKREETVANEAEKTKRKKSSSKTTAVGSNPKSKKARCAIKPSSSTAPLKKPQAKVPSGTVSNHSNAISLLVGQGCLLNKPSDHVAAKVGNKKIKFKEGEVFSCQNAENINHECTRAYCKGCFAVFIQVPEETTGSCKKRRSRGLSSSTTTCEHSKSSSYKHSNKEYVTKNKYNDGTLRLPTHCAGCGGEFV